MIGQAIEIGEPLPYDVEPDDERTWHFHDTLMIDGKVESHWGYGVRCTGCYEDRSHLFGQGKKVHFSVERLKNQNAAGVTATEMEKEIIDTAKREGRADKIDRAR